MLNPTLQTNKAWKKIVLDPNKKYIWVMDKDGHLRVGEEVQVGVKENLGHPTLTEGQKGRIGGKLRRDPETGTWTVNGSSGRYTKNYKRTQAQLDAAAEEIKAAGIDVRKTVPLLN